LLSLAGYGKAEELDGEDLAICKRLRIHPRTSKLGRGFLQRALIIGKLSYSGLSFFEKNKKFFVGKSIFCPIIHIGRKDMSPHRGGNFHPSQKIKKTIIFCGKTGFLFYN